MTTDSSPNLVAVSLGEGAAPLLVNGARGVVQGVYRAAVNIVFRGGLVSVVPESSGRGPINVTVALEGLEMTDFGLRAGEPVALGGGTLDLGGRLLVSLRSAVPRSTPGSFSPVIPSSELERNLEAARRTGLTQGNLSGLGEILSGRDDPDGRRFRGNSLFASAALPRVQRLAWAVRAGDPSLTRRAVSDLIGLGPGLTPSSDDMLAGMALFMVIYSRSSRTSVPGCDAAVNAVAGECAGRTTALSEAYLRQAAAGRGNDTVMDLCEALLTGGEEAVVQVSRRLLGIGMTSGTDALLGVVLGGWLCIGSAPLLGGDLPW